MVKECLQRYLSLRNKIASQKRQLSALKEDVASLTGVDYSKDKIATTFSKEPDFIRRVERIDALEREISRTSEQCLAACEEISGMIMRVSDYTCQEILTERYLFNRSWDEIVADIKYSKSHIYRLHKKGLDEIEKSLFNG